MPRIYARSGNSVRGGSGHGNKAAQEQNTISQKFNGPVGVKSSDSARQSTPSSCITYERTTASEKNQNPETCGDTVTSKKPVPPKGQIITSQHRLTRRATSSEGSQFAVGGTSPQLRRDAAPTLGDLPAAAGTTSPRGQQPQTNFTRQRNNNLRGRGTARYCQPTQSTIKITAKAIVSAVESQSKEARQQQSTIGQPTNQERKPMFTTTAANQQQKQQQISNKVFKQSRQQFTYIRSNQRFQNENGQTKRSTVDQCSTNDNQQRKPTTAITTHQPQLQPTTKEVVRTDCQSHYFTRSHACGVATQSSVTGGDSRGIENDNIFHEILPQNQGQSQLRVEDGLQSLDGPPADGSVGHQLHHSGYNLRRTTPRNRSEQTSEGHQNTRHSLSHDKSHHLSQSKALLARSLQAITPDSYARSAGGTRSQPSYPCAEVNSYPYQIGTETTAMASDNSLRFEATTTLPPAASAGGGGAATANQRTITSDDDLATAAAPTTTAPHGINRQPLKWDLQLLLQVMSIDGIHTFKDIPAKLGSKVANQYNKIMAKVRKHRNKILHWVELFLFPRAVLYYPYATDRNFYKCSAKRRKKILNDYIIQRLQQWDTGGAQRDALIYRHIRAIFLPPRPSSPTTEKQNLLRCYRLATEDFQLGKAIESLFSHGVASPSAELTEKLRAKHPTAAVPITGTWSTDMPAFIVTQENLTQQLRSFPKGTSCGRSGLRVSHLMSFVTANIYQLTENLVGLLNIIASGLAPSSFAPFLLSAPLVPINKKDGGIRPIAVGEVFRRVVSKIAMASVKRVAEAFLAPLQVGVGTSNAAETILHVFNRVVSSEELDENVTFLQLDIDNAFNSVHRPSFLHEVQEHFPQLLPWVQYSYCCSAILFTGSDVIHSEAGVQQGDPLGPLLFALALQPVLQKVSDFARSVDPLSVTTAYLDDVTLKLANPKLAAQCVKLFTKCAKKIGLNVSLTKSRMWMPKGHSPLLTQVSEKYQIPYSSEAGIELLGGAVSANYKYHAQIAQSRVEKAKQSIKLMMELKDPQLCLMLLRSCLGMVKLNYAWRCTPPQAIRTVAEDFEKFLANILTEIVVNHGPGFGPFQLHMASLPTNMGGLGITLPTDTLHFAHLASHYSTVKLQQQILPSCPQFPEPQFTELHEEYMRNLHGEERVSANADSIKELSLVKIQQQMASWYFTSKLRSLLTDDYLRYWADAGFLYQQSVFLKSMCYNDPICRAAIQQAIKANNRCNNNDPILEETLPAPHNPACLSYHFLHAMPNAGMGQKMDPAEFRTILGLRLLIRLPIVPVTQCPLEGCTQALDPFGYHFLSCIKKGNLQIQRHDLVAKALHDLAKVAGFNPTLNAPVQCLGFNEHGDTTQLRPADVLMMGDTQPLACVDVTVVSPLTEAKSHTAEGRIPGKAASNAAKAKYGKHEIPCTKDGKEFIAFACDVTGMIDSEAFKLLERIATKYADRKGQSTAWGLTICKRRISFAIQHAISRQLISGLQQANEKAEESDEEEPCYL